MTIQEMLTKKALIQKELDKWDRLIDAYRAVCEHLWVYDGHGHNDDYYKCSLCGGVKD